jgi:hypothetical protein
MPAQVAAPVADRSEWEVFYSYPSLSAPALFEAAARAAAGLPGAGQGGAAEALEDLQELAGALQVLALGFLFPPFLATHSHCFWVGCRHLMQALFWL